MISEPKGGRRRWKGKRGQQAAFYANRNNIRSDAGKGWMRKRGELLERAFTHDLDEGGMRRVWLKGHANIAKRLLVHVAGFNLGLLMRKLIGAGTPRAWAERAARAYAAIFARYFTHLRHLMAILRRLLRDHGFLLDDDSVHTESVELSLAA